MANRTNPSDLIRLQAEVEHIRNFCILAHVDHGKTTLSDSLVSSNGIISARLAGKLRFLDSTEEEQKRGITMHSSAISLLFTMEAANAAEGNAAAAGAAQEEYLINLVDSPGHIDFSSDVSTAARLCDGALILVDVLEGVCTQTHAVIYKALRERMRPCLVLNKIDRLIVELRLTPLEAFHHLRRIIENVNALAFSLVTSELMRISLEQHQLQQQQALHGHVAEVLPTPPKTETSSTAPSNGEEEDHPLHQEWTFSPEKGNVQFASAIDGWSFGLMKFINMWHKKLGLNKGILKKYLFEDYCLNVDTKKITKYDSSDSTKQPMFVSLVLEPIYELYENIVIQQQLQAGVSIAKEKLGIELPPREANPRDLRASLQAIMRRWLPLADSILRMVVRNMPTPQEAQARRVSTLFAQSNPGVRMDGSVEEDAAFVTSRTNVVLESITACSQAEESPLVVFISKMMPVRVAELSKEDVAMLNAQRQRKHALQQQQQQSSGETTEGVVPVLKPEDEVFMALGRVFSGMLHRNSKLYVLGHKYDPVHFYREHGKSFQSTDGNIESDLDWSSIGSSSNAEIKYVEGEGDRLGCYILLGPSVHACTSVGAGNIVGIVGLEDYVFKTATLSSTVLSYPLKAITFQSKPMLKVAVDPVSHVDLSNVSQGLQQLYQVDPVVEIGMEDNGQHTMTCLGELHLDQCVKALTEKFAKCEIKVSEPIVSFRETLVPFDDSTANNTTNTALPPPWGDTAGLHLAKKGRITVSLDSANVSIAVRNFAMPIEAVNVLEQDSTSTQVLTEQLAARVYQTDSSTITSNDIVEEAGVGQMWTKFTELLSPYESHISQALGSSSSTGLSKQLLQLGPTSCPTNMLLFHTNVHIEIYATTVPSSSGGDGETVLLTKLYRNTPQGSNAGGVSHAGIFYKLWQRLQSSVFTGFNEATKAGPLMNEPVTALGFVIDKVSMSRVYVDTILNETERQLVYSGTTVSNESDANLENLTSLQTGQLISAVKDSLRLSMLSCPVRIVEPIYQCDLQCDQSQLGNLYAVLSKRRGHVYQEDIIEGTTMFLLSAYLPVANSFQFAQELLKKTSGSGTAPQLSFSHWQLLEQDPFWRPRTEDELEEFGEQFMDEHNRAKMWINKIRKRKGLAVDEQVVNSAEKQRTLSRKK